MILLIDYFREGGITLVLIAGVSLVAWLLALRIWRKTNDLMRELIDTKVCLDEIREKGIQMVLGKKEGGEMHRIRERMAVLTSLWRKVTWNGGSVKLRFPPN